VTRRRTKWKDRLLSRRKDPRLIVGGLGLLLLLFTAGFYLVQRNRDLPSFLVTNRVLLFVLWYINVVLILAVLFVLLRNLFKLLIERRHRILGAKFKFKLVATFFGLSLIPVLLLFAIASELLQGSVERWFNTPLKPVLRQGNTVSQALYEQIEHGDLRLAGRALAEVRGFDLKNAAARARLTHRLQELQGELGVDYLAVYEGSEFVQAVVNPEAGLANLPEPGHDFLEEIARRGQALRREERPAGHGRLLMAGIRGPLVSGPRSAPPLVVVAGSLLSPALADASEALIQSFQSFRQLEVQKDDLKASHLLIFLMVTLLILLASSWAGLYLARRVTVPIQALAEGTRRIGLGDLDHRVEVDADDELGVLVRSFNQMTEDLQSNKELLEHSNRELSATALRLGEERALLAAVLENVAAGVVSTDASGRIFTCNGAALAILRQREEEVLGRRVEEAWPDSERGKLATLLDHDPPAGQGSREIHLILGGEWKTFEAKITPMRTPDDALLGRVLVIEDLTELIKAQQLAAWNEAARRIAHEIKNPLTPIRLSTEHMREVYRRDPDHFTAVFERCTDNILTQVDELRSIAAEFSAYSAIPRIDLQPGNLTAAIAGLVEGYRAAPPEGVAVELDIVGAGNGGAPIETRFDAKLLSRAVRNLLENALRASAGGGKVVVQVERLNGTARIVVSDHGPGVRPELLGRIFDPYFSTHDTGTGLGLPIARRIAEEHGGGITARNRPEGGLEVAITLPIQ